MIDCSLEVLKPGSFPGLGSSKVRSSQRDQVIAFTAIRLLKSKVHPNGFEPLTFGSVDRCSIQLSYGCARVALAARLMRDIVTQGSAFGKRGLGFLD